MAAGDATTADIPSRYDVALNGKGYVLLDSLEPSLPFRTHRATYGYTQTFIERSNVSGAYSDNQQDFFLTASQHDWSEGYGQSYYRAGDPDKSRRYYDDLAVETSRVPGEVTLRYAKRTLTLTANPVAGCGGGVGVGLGNHFYVTSTNLYSRTSGNVETDQGAHGAGAPNQWGVCVDGGGNKLYIAGATKIRKWNGSAFSDFSATANAGALATLNNALYSCDGSTLNTYDTSGVKSTLFTWKDNTGTALTPLAQIPKLIPFGGKLLIFWPYLRDRPELWIYDGTGVSAVVSLPKSAIGYDITEIEGVVYLSGTVYDSARGSTGLVPVVWDWTNGTVNELWRSTAPGGTTPAVNSPYAPALGTLAGMLLFTSLTDARLFEYNLGPGAASKITSISGWSSSSGAHFISSTVSTVMAFAPSSTTSYMYPDATSVATAGLLQTSLFDFDNSLDKYMRGIKVDWSGTAGTSIDISYGVDGFTTVSLQTGAVSGTEYTLPANTVGKAISVYLALNGTAAATPTLRRVYVRAAPLLQSFKTREYILDMSGDASRSSRTLRDGTPHPLTGRQQADNLITAVTASAPFTIIDRFSSFTGVIEPSGTELYEIHPSADNNASSGTFVAKVTVREV